MVITMAKLRMAHASTHGARKPPGPINFSSNVAKRSGRTIVVSKKYMFDWLEFN